VLKHVPWSIIFYVVRATILRRYYFIDAAPENKIEMILKIQSRLSTMPPVDRGIPPTFY